MRNFFWFDKGEESRTIQASFLTKLRFNILINTSSKYSFNIETTLFILTVYLIQKNEFVQNNDLLFQDLNSNILYLALEDLFKLNCNKFDIISLDNKLRLVFAQ